MVRTGKPTPYRCLRAVTRTSVAALVCAATLMTVPPAVAEPTNPSDADLENARAALTTGANDVAGLAGKVTQAQEEIARIELDMGALREEVNKSLVDLHDAQSIAERARQDAAAAKRELDGTQSELEDAQRRLDEISRTTYRRGASSPMTALAGESTSREALDRSTFLRTNAEKQRAAIEDLDRARTKKANNESRLREARNVAEQRESEAQSAQDAARQAIENNTAKLDSAAAQRDQLVSDQENAQRRLDSAKSHAEGLLTQREEYNRYQAEAEAQRKAEKEAAERAAEAERRADEAARARAQKEKEEAARARAEAEEKARQQDLIDKAKQAAAAKEAQRVEATQPTHTELDSPYPTSEDAAAGPVAELQNPGAQDATEETGTTGTGVGSSSGTQDQQGTDAAEETTEQEAAPAEAQGSSGSAASGSDAAGQGSSAVVSGARSELVETVIARATSQIGVPYAWGGGTATGPSLGIRDGGVADSYGDYNKVGFDCSGLVVYAFAGVGISLPHYSGYQYQRGTQLDPSQMQRGDLIFYGPSGNQHVAIYLGDGTMVEAPQSGSYVQISPVRWSGMSPYVVRLL